MKENTLINTEDEMRTFLYGVVAGALIVSAVGWGCTWWETPPANAQGYWPPVTPHGYGPGQAQYERDQQEQTLRELYLRQQLQHGMRPPC